jgi:hypothetical protein
MGSQIEINDTLKLKRGAGFPANVALNGTYSFSLPGRRLYHLHPVRVFLVEEIEGQWNMVGHAMIMEQTIDAVRNETRGTYQIVSLYPPEYAAMVNRYDAPPRKGYCPPKPSG